MHTLLNHEDSNTKNRRNVHQISLVEHMYIYKILFYMYLHTLVKHKCACIFTSRKEKRKYYVTNKERKRHKNTSAMCVEERELHSLSLSLSLSSTQATWAQKVPRTRREVGSRAGCCEGQACWDEGQEEVRLTHWSSNTCACAKHISRPQKKWRAHTQKWTTKKTKPLYL